MANAVINGLVLDTENDELTGFTTDDGAAIYYARDVYTYYTYGGTAENINKDIYDRPNFKVLDEGTAQAAAEVTTDSLEQYLKYFG